MKSFKEIAEARFVATADYKVSASGRKVHKMKKIADDPRDKDGDGDVDADDEKLKESIELEEAVSVKKQDYSWGKMVTVHHGSDTSYPLHPEHQNAIKKLKDGEHTSFTDETNRKVTAHREGDNVHLSSRDSNKKTTVAHSHFTESVNKSDVPAYLRKKTGDKLTTQDLEKERTKNRSHPETIKKINGTEMKEAVDKQEQRFLMLARLGLVDKSEVSKLRVAIDQLKADKQLTVQQRTMLLGVMEDLISLVTGDDMVFNRIKQDVQKEDYELVEEEETIIETKDNVKDDDQLPFDPDPPKKNPTATAGKHGSGYSTARHLARLALQKQQQKKQGK